jgi:hypothetical protein
MRAHPSGRYGIPAAALVTALLVAGPAPADEGARSEPAARATAASAEATGGGVTAATAAHRSHGGRPPSRVHSWPRSTRHGVYLGWSPYWGASWGGYWGAYWDPYWYGPRLGYTVVYPRAGDAYGALDTDVSPERAEIWVDGRKVGRADDFDGFPSYLWLDKGTYDVVIYLPGYKTIARQYSIYPGLVIDVEDRMEPGDAVHPLDLGPTSHERRDERLRRDRERRESAPPSRWEAGEPEAGVAEEGDWLDARSEPGRLRVEVAPDDASIYLDGRFVGTGADLGRLRAGLLVDSGTHTLEIVRPGYASERRQVEVAQGDETALRVVLEPAPESP